MRNLNRTGVEKNDGSAGNSPGRALRRAGGYVIAACLVAGLMLLAFPGCSALDRYVFTVKKGVPVTPEKYGIPYHEVWFPSLDGLQLNGWFIPGNNGKPLVLYFHGNGGSLSDNLGYANILHRSGFPILIFDYRGYGKSDGRPLREEDLYQDARGALAYLKGLGWRPERMIFFGQSLGSAVALQMALEEEPAGLVLESSFTSISEMFRYVSPLGYYTIGWWHNNFPFDNISKISRTRAPLLLIHGTEDPIIPVEMTRRLFARATSEKMLYIIEGGGHCDAFERDVTSYQATWEGYHRMLSPRLASH